ARLLPHLLATTRNLIRLELLRPGQIRGARKGDRAGLSVASAVSESLWTNADDRLPVASFGRVEGGDGIVEGRDGADVRSQSSVPHPLDALAQLGTIGLDNEVDRQTVGGPCLIRPDEGHQRSSGSNQVRGPRPDV